MTCTTFAHLHRSSFLLTAALLLATAAAFTVSLPGIGQAESPAAAQRLKARPKPPQPIKDVFVRTKPHANVGGGTHVPKGPSSLKGQVPELADWYCGEGSGPGGYAECTQDLINSCSGTYKKPGTNGPEQTWGMCHESTG